MSFLRPLPLVVFILALAACGGGDGGNDNNDNNDGNDNNGDNPSVETLIATGIAGLDGTVVGEGGGGTQVTQAAPGTFIAVGEFDDTGAALNNLAQGFVSFDLSDLPSGAVVQSATINVRVFQIRGDSLPGLLGGVIMEHVTLGGSLDLTDFDAPPIGGAPIGGPIPNATELIADDDTTDGFKSADITDAVQTDRTAGRNITSIRLRSTVLGSDGDDKADVVMVFAFDPNDTANEARPFLEIEYTVPE